MTLDLSKIKSDAEKIAANSDLLLMALPVKDVLGMLALIADKSEPCDGCFMADAEALRKDAERYRWFRSSGDSDLAYLDSRGQIYPEALDEEIDAAMAKERP